MDHREVGRYWDQNAEVWTQLVREGYDLCRDHLNTPAFLAALPDVDGLPGLDVGCGEGHNTRLLAGRGARMTAVDISPTFVRHARAAEQASPRGIRHLVASALELPFPDASFAFATAFMVLMDIPDHAAALAEVRRVLRPGGFFQFSLNHPCFFTPFRRHVHDTEGRRAHLMVGDYFASTDGMIDEWTFGAAPAEVKARVPKFQVPRFHRTLSGWLNLLIETGFVIEHVVEPTPTDEQVAACPYIADEQIVPNFLHLRVRRPEES